MPRFSFLVLACLIVACDSPTENGPGLNGRRLSVGETTACQLTNDGAVLCWGSNVNMEYGVTQPQSGVPVATPVPQLRSISGGWAQHRCGLTNTGAVCWGRAGSGQLGDGQIGPTQGGNPVVSVSGTMEWSDIRVGRLTTCGVSTAQDAWCWGLNQFGELGDSTLATGDRVAIPGKVDGDIKFSQVVPGWTHTCGISTAGAAYCWGNNSHGQLGIGFADGPTGNVPHPRPLIVSFQQQFKSISLGARSTCAITVADQLMCWGYNATGQLGDGTTTDRHVPTLIGDTIKFTQVALGSGFAEGVRPEIVKPTGTAQGGIAHGCALNSGQFAYCWGWNGAGQVGDGTATNRLVPVAVTGGLKFTTIALGGGYSCAMTAAFATYCWGSNYAGQLGEGTYLDKNTAVKVATP